LEKNLNDTVYPLEGLCRMGNRIGLKDGYRIIKELK